MSRPEIIKQLKSKHPNLNKSQLEKIVDVFFESIKNALILDRTVEIRGFGTFFVKRIKEKYSARNPSTGKMIYVPEKNRVRFRASKKLKQLINE